VITVLLAEDQHVIRSALKALIDLSPDMEVVADLERGDQIVETARRVRPDVAVLDIDLPGLDGLTAAERLRLEVPSCQCLVLTGLSQPSHVLRALQLHVRGFLRTLKPKALAMAAAFPDRLDPARIRRAYSMWTFDEFVTAPLHGFAGANDYWSRASSKPWLASIALPTLVLNARNDPFIPAASLPRQGDAGRHVLLEQPAHGGHAGFLVGPVPGNLGWLPQRVVQFFKHGV